MGRTKLVSDGEIRKAVIDLVCDGIPPVTSRVREKLLENVGHAGETARIARVTKEVIESLGEHARVPVGDPNIPAELAKETGELVAKMYSLAIGKADKLFDKQRQALELQTQKAIEKADKRVAELERAHATLGDQLRSAREQITGLESSQANLAARNDQLTTSLAKAQATLEAERRSGEIEIGNLNKRILELEEALKTKSAQPMFNMDELVDRLTQATKGNNS